MKQKLLIGLLFILSIQVFAQDQKWNVEANYSVVPQDGFGGRDGIIEIGLKYRFADFDFANLGLSFNTGFSNEKFDDIPNVNGRLNTYYFQPRVFSEFKVPSIEKWRLGIGLGYSIVNADSSVISIGEDISSNTTNGGFNLNLGLSYNLTKRFFIQAQYDFINLNVRDEFLFRGEIIKPSFNEKINNIRVGIAYRF